MTQGEIVLLPFPFSDKDASKLHPAVVLAEVHYGPRSDLILVMISTKLRKCTDQDVLLENTHPDFGSTRLHWPSFIKTGAIATIDRGRVERRLGHLGTAHHEELRTKLRARLAL